MTGVFGVFRLELGRVRGDRNNWLGVSGAAGRVGGEFEGRKLDVRSMRGVMLGVLARDADDE